MRQVTTFAFVLCSIILLSGCGSDETPTTSNSVKFNGSSFSVLSASILGVSIDGEGHAGISFTNVTNSGISKTLTIDIEYSGNGSVEGRYSYPQAAGDLYLDEFLTNYTEIDISGGGSEYFTQLEGGGNGTVTVQHHGGDNYSVTMDLVMEDGSEFTGKYRGNFVVVFNDN